METSIYLAGELPMRGGSGGSASSVPRGTLLAASLLCEYLGGPGVLQNLPCEYLGDPGVLQNLPCEYLGDP